MPSSYSPQLRFELIASGEQAGLWGSTTNKNIGELIEQAISGVTNISLVGQVGDKTLSTLDGADDEARSAVLQFTGPAPGPVNIIIPTSTKLYVVRNSSSQTITVKTLGQIGGVTIATGEATLVFCDGTDARPGIQTAGVGPTTVANGGTGTNGFGLGGFIKSSGTTNALTAAQTVRLTAEVSEILPIANGGTGSSNTAYCSLTSNVVNTLPVANGGTGQPSLTAGALLVGAGASAVGFIPGSANGEILTYNGSSWVGRASGLGAGNFTNTNITVNAQGIITAISTGSSGSGITAVSGSTTVTANTAGTTVTVSQTSGQVVAALGFTPYNNTNPAGFITSAGTAAVATAVTATVTNSNQFFKVPFLNTTGSTTGNYGLLQDATETFLYDPSSNRVISGSFGSSTVDLIPNRLNGFNLQDDGNLVMGHSNANPTGFYASFAFNNNISGAIQGTAGGNQVAYNTSSDYRLKENVKPMVGALDRINSLKPCTYTWKSNQYKSEGFIAHEMQEFFPGAVSGEKDAVNEDGSIKAQGIDTSLLVAALVASVQELKAGLDAANAEIAALKAK